VSLLDTSASEVRLDENNPQNVRLRVELIRGTLDTVILRTLAGGPMYGYGIVDWIRRATKDALQIEDGALYGALHRMQERGFLDSYWGSTEGGRRAKFYQLTAAGRKELARVRREWEAYAEAVSRVFEGG
jgi:transcriptional regulator